MFLISSQQFTNNLWHTIIIIFLFLILITALGEVHLILQIVTSFSHICEIKDKNASEILQIEISLFHL